MAGVLSVRDAMRIVVLRGKVMDAAPSGAMTTIPANEETTRTLIGCDLDIAALNAPEASVVSGTTEAIVALEKRLRGPISRQGAFRSMSRPTAGFLTVNSKLPRRFRLGEICDAPDSDGFILARRLGPG